MKQEIIKMSIPCLSSDHLEKDIQTAVERLIQTLMGLPITIMKDIQEKRGNKHHLKLIQEIDSGSSLKLGTCEFLLSENPDITITLDFDEESIRKWHKHFKTILKSDESLEQDYCVLRSQGNNIEVACLASLYTAIESAQSFDENLQNEMSHILRTLSLHDAELAKMLYASFIDHDKKCLFSLHLLHQGADLFRTNMMDIAMCICCNLHAVLKDIESVKRFQQALQYLIQNHRVSLEQEIKNMSSEDLKIVIEHDTLGLVSEVIFSIKHHWTLSNEDVIDILKNLGQHLNQAVARGDQISVERLSRVLKSFVGHYQTEISNLLISIHDLSRLQKGFEIMQRSSIQGGVVGDGFLRQSRVKIEQANYLKQTFFEVIRNDQYGLVLQLLSRNKRVAGLLSSNIGSLLANSEMRKIVHEWVLNNQVSTVRSRVKKGIQLLRMHSSSKDLSQYSTEGKSVKTKSSWKGRLRRICKNGWRRVTRSKKVETEIELLPKCPSLNLAVCSVKQEEITARQKNNWQRLWKRYRDQCLRELRKGNANDVLKNWMTDQNIPFVMLSALLREASKRHSKSKVIVRLSRVFSHHIYYNGNCPCPLWKYIEDKVHECADLLKDDENKAVWVQGCLLHVQSEIFNCVLENLSHENIGIKIFQNFQVWLSRMQQYLKKRQQIEAGSTGQVLIDLKPTLHQTADLKRVKPPQQSLGDNVVVLFPAGKRSGVNSSFELYLPMVAWVK